YPADPHAWTPPATDLRPRNKEKPVIRTHDAGSLRSGDVGTQVTLAGWVARRRDHGGVTIIDLRDSTGAAQVVVRDEAVAHRLRAEDCLRIVGTVADRPEGNTNDAIATGDIEVLTDEVVILSESAPLPFPIDEHVDVGEEVRL